MERIIQNMETAIEEAISAGIGETPEGAHLLTTASAALAALQIVKEDLKPKEMNDEN